MSMSPSEGLWNSILAPEKPPGDVSYLSDCYNVCFVQKIYSLYLFFPISKDFSRRQGCFFNQKVNISIKQFPTCQEYILRGAEDGKALEGSRKGFLEPLASWADPPSRYLLCFQFGFYNFFFPLGHRHFQRTYDTPGM